jgi:phenylalanyl-tRNA synthetase alpha chain
VDLADLTRDLETLQAEALAAIAAATDSAALAALELDVLGKKGRLTGVLRGIGGLPAEDRPTVGAIANTVRVAVEAALVERNTALRGSELRARLVAETVDVTTPGRPIRRGTLHPIQETIDEIAAIFGQFGFVVYEGPEVEDDVRNFQMLNIPPDHPARDLWDTLYVDVEGHLLRTHTSPGQIRVMHQEAPPIRALLPGRCYRYEAIDASHASEFFQVEGLMVDEGTTMGDLKGLLDMFAKAMYGADKRTRFRPGVRGVRRIGLSGLLADRVDDHPRRGHGPPGRPPVRRPRSGALPGLRLRHGCRAHRQPAPQRRRPAPVHGQRPSFPRPVPVTEARVS